MACVSRLIGIIVITIVMLKFSPLQTVNSEVFYDLSSHSCC